MENVEAVLDRIRSYKNLKNDKEIAELLGIAPSDFSGRKKRGTLVPLIVEWGMRQGVISMDWLLKGTNIQVAEGNNNIQVGGGVGGNLAPHSAAMQPVAGSPLGEIEEVKELLRYAPIDYLMEIKKKLLRYKGIRDEK